MREGIFWLFDSFVFYLVSFNNLGIHSFLKLCGEVEAWWGWKKTFTKVSYSFKFFDQRSILTLFSLIELKQKTKAKKQKQKKNNLNFKPDH